MEGIMLVGPSRPWRLPGEPRHRSASLHALAAISRIDAVLGPPRPNGAATTKGCQSDSLSDGPCPSRSTTAVEYCSAATVEVDQRLIRIIAVPYEAPAQVVFRGRLWTEVFSRGAFGGVEERPTTIRVNRDHDRGRTIGKVVRFDPHHPRGLLAEIRVARTVLGDESLVLASEDMLSASVGFAVPSGGEQLDHRQRIRRITTAVLDHIALVESPAYDGAQVLAVG